MKRKKKQMNIISDTMEKYCKSCGRVFKDSDFKICPYCGNQLSTRTGRQSIPRKLRHQVFQRDGYRCRECGATNKQTRLHVDHIKPVAKGGTNDLSNLQTLCEACNRAKYTDEWVGGLYDGSHSNFKRNNRVSDSKLYESNGMQKEINMNKQSEKKHHEAESRRETTQDKINRWKRAGWGATQEEMERWEQARKDKGATNYNLKIPCPVCGKLIKAKALRCKYCKTMLKEYKNKPEYQKKLREEIIESKKANKGFQVCPNCNKEIPKNELGFVGKARRAQDRHKRSMVGQTSWVQDKTKQANREKDRREKFIKEKNRKEEARLKSESTVVTGEVKCLGEGTYRYTYKTSDGQKGSIYGSSIEDLKIKSRQYKIQWNP